jgi:hypothetical protein
MCEGEETAPPQLQPGTLKKNQRESAQISGKKILPE